MKKNTAAAFHSLCSAFYKVKIEIENKNQFLKSESVCEKLVIRKCLCEFLQKPTDTVMKMMHRKQLKMHSRSKNCFHMRYV